MRGAVKTTTIFFVLYALNALLLAVYCAAIAYDYPALIVLHLGALWGASAYVLVRWTRRRLE